MRLGEMLIEREQITSEDLERALEIQKERNEKIGKILVDLGFVAMRDVMAALSDQLSVPLANLDSPPPVTPEIEGLSAKFLRQSRCLPLAVRDSTLTMAMADPLDFETQSVVKNVTLYSRKFFAGLLLTELSKLLSELINKSGLIATKHCAKQFTTMSARKDGMMK